MSNRVGLNIDQFHYICNRRMFQVSCTIPNVGAAGEGQFHNGLCVLTQVRLHAILLCCLYKGLCHQKLFTMRGWQRANDWSVTLYFKSDKLCNEQIIPCPTEHNQRKDLPCGLVLVRFSGALRHHRYVLQTLHHLLPQSPLPPHL